jgi:hypothetical protein
MQGKNYSKSQGCAHFFVSLQAIKTRSEELDMEIQLLAQKLEELEQLARKRGLAGVLNIRHANVVEDKKSKSN